MVASDPNEAENLSETVAAINELIAALGRDRRIINTEKVHYATGIPVETISAVLAGEQVKLDDMSPALAERLKFLHSTRLKQTEEGERRYYYDEIAEGIGVTSKTVGNILNSKKGASSDVTVALARFFKVEVGYFLDSWSKVLHDALKPQYQQLRDLALLRGVGIKTIRFRGSPVLDDQLGREVMAALRQAVEGGPTTHPEIQELTADLESMPENRRLRVIPVIKELLGLARPDEADTHR